MPTLLLPISIVAANKYIALFDPPSLIKFACIGILIYVICGLKYNKSIEVSNINYRDVITFWPFVSFTFKNIN